MTPARPYAPLWILLLLTAVGHLPLMLVPPLSSDEALYWEWSRHLALGYYTHPPMVGWANALVTGLMGTSVASVRLTALLFHLGALALVYQMALEITGETRVPLLAGLAYALLPVSLILGTATVTDCPLVFFWALAAWLVKRAVIDGQRGLWYPAGVAAGGMMLSKFFAILFYPGLLAFLLLHPAHRRELARKEPWLAVLLALAVFSPFIWWNATHQWLTIQFNLMNRQGATGLGALKPLEYVAGQMIAMSPVWFPVLVVALVVVLRAGWRRMARPRPAWAALEGPTPAERTADALWFYAWMTAVPFAVFAVVSLTAKVGAHWTAAFLPTGMVVLFAWLYGLDGGAARAGTAGRAPVLRLRYPRTAWAGWIGLLLAAVPLVVLLVDPRVVPERYRVYDEAAQSTPPAAKVWGWREAGLEIDRLRERYGHLPGGLFFSTRDYSDAALLGFYSPEHEPFALMGYRPDEFHGKEFLYWAAPFKRPGTNTIFVMDEPIWPGNLDRIAPYFRTVEPLDTLVVRNRDGRVVRKFFFALGRDYRANEPDVLSRW